MSTEVINAIFSGLVLLLGALAGAANVRARKLAVDRREHRDQQRRLITALNHIYVLETFCAIRGLVPPARPAELEDDDDEPDAPPPRLPPPPVPADP